MLYPRSRWGMTVKMGPLGGSMIRRMGLGWVARLSRSLLSYKGYVHEQMSLFELRV